MPQAVFVIELSAPFWVRNKVPEIDRKAEPKFYCGEKNAEIVRWKIRVVRIEDFQPVQAIKEHIEIFEAGDAGNICSTE